MNEIPTENSAPTGAAPVSETERLKVIDALRGVALLGILLMNIPGFAMPDYFSESFKSDPANVNFWVSAVISVVFEGKMRALFGMIFGAGVLLFVSKKEQAGRSVTRLFYRRMFWLVLFGLIHAHLILWIGDILYLYGFCGMLVYLCRKVKPIYLVLGVPLVAVVDFTAGTLFYQHVRASRIAYVEASTVAAENKPLTEVQKDALARWREIEKTLIPNREDAKENTRKMKSDYATVASYLRPLAWKVETILMPIEIWDSLALMLLGLALYQWGFLSGQWSSRDYGKVMAIGYGIGLPLAIYSFYHSYLYSPNLEANLRRMELVPIEWVGLIFVVIAIWIAQLIVSPLWLRFFFFGPLEWVWRSLTYWKRQPFMRPE
jgi:uncharacterized protein